ncbi:MAG TPA: DUF169 domain-containing protein [Polyangia bacterium]|nr:DUF169 domain-containing protein [Polyangia bacterium]
MTTTLEALLGLRSTPVAISFLPSPPAGVAHVASAEPAGCGYWRRAAAGEVFYTESGDHLGCPVGAHTHGVPMDAAKAKELEQLIGVMVGLEYLSMDEIPKIPTRRGAFGVVVYAPLGKSPVAPDVVLVRGDVRQLMLLTEAAQSANLGSGAPTMGRPTCAVLPDAINSDRTSSSFGCIGNRVYTGASDNEGYFAIPGDQLSKLEARLAIVARANVELEKFHRARLPVV